MSAYRTRRDTPRRALADLADRQHGVVARDQLRERGWSDTAIHRAVAEGRLRRMHLGVYAVGHRSLRVEGRWLGAVLACGPGAALSHRSAAALWELHRSDRDQIDVIGLRRRGTVDPVIDLHRTRRLEPRGVTMHRGVRVTGVARTLVDLAGVVEQSVLERVLAQAEVLGLYDHGALIDALDRSNGRRGARALRAAISAAPTMTRSELERRFLRLCARHDIPRPLVNATVCGHEVDFLWPSARLIVETDGHAYHRTRLAFERDRRRDADLMLAGYRVLRITHRRLLTDPEGVARTVAALVWRSTSAMRT
jgi:very-short-patch-repair endonuclease